MLLLLFFFFSVHAEFAFLSVFITVLSCIQLTILCFILLYVIYYDFYAEAQTALKQTKHIAENIYFSYLSFCDDGDDDGEKNVSQEMKQNERRLGEVATWLSR